MSSTLSQLYHDGLMKAVSVEQTKVFEAAEQFEKELNEAFPGYEIVKRPLSLSISCHIGPGALAVAVSKKI